MRYVGSKRRIAKKILAEVLARREDRDVYWEPFVGGLNSFVVIAPHFRKSYGSDTHIDLIMMWNALQNGWTPPETITEDEYKALRDQPSSALRGLAGFGGSFGGKWFGGFARGGYNADGSPRNHQKESIRAVINRIESLANTDVTFTCTSYDRGEGSPRMVIYCDPPYASTLGYKGTDGFDHMAFWTWAERTADTGALVIVSEYSAPNSWKCIAEFDHSMSVALTKDRKTTVERLFTWKG